MTVIPDNDFGARLRQRLQDEEVIWLTTTSANGTPQPNPVWFLAEDDGASVLIYSATNAARLDHIAVRPRVALNFNTDHDGENVAVLLGVAEQALDEPAADQHEAYLAKYRDGITRIGSNPAKFAVDYGVPVRVVVEKVRGF